MWKSALVLAFAFALSQSASAALVDNGTYLTDTVSGLDWLKLTQTINRSYNDVSSQLGTGGEFSGWRYASGAQFESLLLGQGIVPDVGCSDGTNFCGGTNPANYLTIDSLVNSIGDTFEKALYDESTSTADETVGLLSDSAYTSAHNIAVLVGSNLSTPYARTNLNWDQADGLSGFNVGSFLVRPSEVPVPAAGYLFISAIAALFGRLRCSLII